MLKQRERASALSRHKAIFPKNQSQQIKKKNIAQGNLHFQNWNDDKYNHRPNTNSKTHSSHKR